MQLFQQTFNRRLKSSVDAPKYEELRSLSQNCQLCPLSQNRTNVVFGQGLSPSKLMLIGEAPGQTEDETGLPFVGRAGQLLEKILATVQINREKDLYITNVVKCRPPNNRLPSPKEVETCYPYLLAQIELIRPKIILLAGALAVKTIVGTNEALSKLRGRWLTVFNGVSAIPIFHPSYLLRYDSRSYGSPKWLTWQDMKAVKNALNYFLKVEELETGVLK